MRSTISFLALVIVSITNVAVAADTNSVAELQQAKAAMQTDLDLAEKHIEKALAGAPQNAEVQFNVI